MAAEFHTQFKPYQPKKGEQYMVYQMHDAMISSF